jgi:hypothetical protein
VRFSFASSQENIKKSLEKIAKMLSWVTFKYFDQKHIKL